MRTTRIWQIIGASSVGTMIEWYDFYIFGSLATIIAPLFYPQGNNTLALIAYLSTFAVGFVVRPFGALFFGRIGDLVGRKYAFLVTLLIMGGATALIGFLPTYATIGVAAPIILLVIRILQGLALGGEYGGAAVYVAEHVPDERRGFFTSFIQITATLGLFLSLVVILVIQNLMSREAFATWGWRLPFIISIFLVAVSLYIRLRMQESPIFTHIKSAGMTSAQPLKEAFTQWANLKRVLISLFGATAGQGVVWYTGQFYALFYLQTILKVNTTSANYIVATRAVVRHPFLCLVWRVIRSVWTKENHDARLFARRAHLFADLSRDATSRGFTGRHRRIAAECGNRRDQSDTASVCQRNSSTRRRSSNLHEFGKPFSKQRGVEADTARICAGDFCHHGVRADCCLSRRSISGEDSLHVAVAAISHR